MGQNVIINIRYDYRRGRNSTSQFQAQDWKNRTISFTYRSATSGEMMQPNKGMNTDLKNAGGFSSRLCAAFAWKGNYGEIISRK